MAGKSLKSGSPWRVDSGLALREFVLRITIIAIKFHLSENVFVGGLTLTEKLYS